MTDLTVVVPTYNGSRLLSATLDSLAAQTVGVRVLVVDDGSTDDTASIADQHPVGCGVVRQMNRGVAAARNLGLARATTDWVAFLDQDDLWHATRAECLLDLARKTHAAAVGTAEQAFADEADREALHRIGDGREKWPSWIGSGCERLLYAGPAPMKSGGLETLDLNRLMQGPVAVTTSLMYRRECAITAGGCATFVRAADDHVLNVNMVRIFGPIKRIDHPMMYYRVHPAATTVTSPLVAPLLTLQLALRHGRALPSDSVTSDYFDHLLWQLPSEPSLSPTEQMALLALSVPGGRRLRWMARWGKRALSLRAFRPRV